MLFGAYVRSPAREVWSGGLVELLRDFEFSTGAARVALLRLVRRGLLERVRKGRRVYYVLSDRGERLLAEGDRRIFKLGLESDWDGTWTVLWQFIPQDRRVDRSRLARRLRFLGFGSVQDGTWISPHSREEEVQAAVDDLDVGEYVGVIVGRPASSLQIDRVVARAWNFEELGNRYRGFVDRFARYGSRKRRSGLDDRQAFLVRTEVVHFFREFAFLDPDVPEELIPGSHRLQAAKLFHEIYSALAEPAQRHFDTVTQG